MNYLTLEEIKKQCIIDNDFTDDDAYLTSLGTTAEQLVEQQIDMTLEDVVAQFGEFPEPLKQAMLLIVEYLYDNRGSGDTSIPEAYFYICQTYRNYH